VLALLLGMRRVVMAPALVQVRVQVRVLVVMLVMVLVAVLVLVAVAVTLAVTLAATKVVWLLVLVVELALVASVSSVVSAGRLLLPVLAVLIWTSCWQCGVLPAPLCHRLPPVQVLVALALALLRRR